MNFTTRVKVSGFFLVFLALASCKPSPKVAINPEKERIDSMEAAMKSGNPADPDLNLAMHLAKACQDYEAGHPGDSLSPRFLWRAGQVIETVFDDKGRALELYYAVYKKYPKSPYAPYALFMTGNLHHSIRDSANAVGLLNLFLNKFPRHQLRKNAAELISSFGAEPDTANSNLP